MGPFEQTKTVRGKEAEEAFKSGSHFGAQFEIVPRE